MYVCEGGSELSDLREILLRAIQFNCARGNANGNLGWSWLVNKVKLCMQFCCGFFYLFVAAKIVVCGSLEYSIIYCIKSNTCFVGFETIFKEHHRAAARESLD